jgi:amidase
MQTTVNTARRRFMQAGAAAAALVAVPRLRAHATVPMTVDPVLALSTVEVAKALREGQVTSVELVRKCYERIDAVNPLINAVVAQCRERALAEAEEADALTKAGRPKGPLHDVPFTVKDSFDTAGIVTTGGTLGRKDFVPGADATVVARARAAGAILLGKTNTPEFTLGGGGKGTVNLVYGLSKNPYDVDYQPSGSSGGAGAIVAAAGAYFDIGSDYGGSIRGPAYANGIAGLKPTYGRVPRTGHIVGYGGAFDNFQETGPLARRVEDLTLLMEVLGGPDDWDAAMAPVPLGDPSAVDLKSLRVAFYTTNGAVDPTPELQATVTQTVGYFRKLGAKVTEDRPPKMDELAAARQGFSGADGREYMRRLLKLHGTTQASPGLRLDGDVLPSPDFTRLCEEMDAIKSEQLAWFEQYDLIVCPASERAPIRLDHERPADRPRGASYTSQYNTTGWPAGVVRCGTSSEAAGLPLGVQVVAQPWRDDVVLAALAHIEQQSGGWQATPI